MPIAHIMSFRWKNNGKYIFLLLKYNGWWHWLIIPIGSRSETAATDFSCSQYIPWEVRNYCTWVGKVKEEKNCNFSLLSLFPQVCSEETLNEILQRYLRYNSHAASYTWKHNCVNLDMSRTLEANGIPDEDEDFYNTRMDRDLFSQSICLYFNDDLTELWPHM